jgi:hypothetical protein
MNERIRLLADQAYEMTQDEFRQDWNGDWDRKFQEKFALLIVQECARIARATPAPDFDDLVKQQLGHTWDMAAIETGREIIKHFGVE